jgi:hypothetical protein
MKVGDMVTVAKGHNSIKGKPGKITAITGAKATVQIGNRLVDAPLTSLQPVDASAATLTTVTAPKAPSAPDAPKAPTGSEPPGTLLANGRRLPPGTKICPRCGGSGEWSYNQRDGTMCWKCGGMGYIAAKVNKKAVDISRAKVGDTVQVQSQNMTVTKITWMKPRETFSGSYGLDSGNQKVWMVRVGDGKKFSTIRWWASDGRNYDEVTDAMAGQEFRG